MCDVTQAADVKSIWRRITILSICDQAVFTLVSKPDLLAEGRIFFSEVSMKSGWVVVANQLGTKCNVLFSCGNLDSLKKLFNVCDNC